MKQQDMINRAAGEAALQAAGQLSTRPTALVEFSSRGRVLVVGGDAAWTAAHRLAEPLQPRVIGRTRRPETLAEIEGMEIQAQTALHLDGHLGAFKLAIVSESETSLRLEADLVLDLDYKPLIEGRIPPPGYFRSGESPVELEVVLSRVADMLGVFEKPKFFNYDPATCAHQRNSVTACTRCIDTCPTEAIISIGAQIEVNPNLCQGLGSCATACPSGSIRYAYPAPADALQALRVLLETYRGSGGDSPRLLLHDDATGAEWVAHAELPGNVMPFPLEDVASLGLEAWLCGLAMGASDVSLLCTTDTPEKVKTLLEEQLAVASAVLDGLGLDGKRLRLLEPGNAGEIGEAFDRETSDPPIPAATFALSDDKRAMAFWAIDHLQAHAPAARPEIGLPTGAPFGEVEVNGQACTLCLSCVSSCPGSALQDGYDKPELRFIESNCLQCGLCVQVCPENAAQIKPRLLLDAEARRRPRVLHHEPPFECVSCGKPFATRSVIERMLGKLEGHYMFQGERALRRLQMCEDCRVVDIAQDPEAMEAGLRLHGHQ